MLWYDITIPVFWILVSFYLLPFFFFLVFFCIYRVPPFFQITARVLSLHGNDLPVFSGLQDKIDKKYLSSPELQSQPAGLFLQPLFLCDDPSVHQLHLLSGWVRDISRTCSCWTSTLSGWGTGRGWDVNGCVALTSWLHRMDKGHLPLHQFSGYFASPHSPPFTLVSPLFLYPISFIYLFILNILQPQTWAAQDADVSNPIWQGAEPGDGIIFMQKASVHATKMSIIPLRQWQVVKTACVWVRANC